MTRLFWSTGLSWLVRLAALAANLIGITIVSHALGERAFGTLIIVASFGSWIGLTNIGFGRSLGTIVARYRQKSPAFVVLAVSSATISAALTNGILFFAFSTTFVIAAKFGALGNLFDEAGAELLTSVLILFLAFSVWFFLSVFEGFAAGCHQLSRFSLYSLAGYMLSLLLLLLIFPRYPSLPLATFLLTLGFLPGSIAHAVDTVVRNRDMFCRVRRRSRLQRLIFASAIDFTTIGIARNMMFLSITGIFGIIEGPTQIVALGVFMRLMPFCSSLVMAITYPLSAIVTECVAQKDRRRLLDSITWTGWLVLAVSIFASFGFMIVGRQAITLWIGIDMRYDLSFRIAAAFLIILNSAHLYVAAILASVAETRALRKIHIIEALAVVPASYLFFLLSGQSGILAAIDCILATGVLLMMMLLRKQRQIVILTELGSTERLRFNSVDGFAA